MSDIKTSFKEKGYYLAKGVFSKEEVATLEQDFDHIVAQFVASGEQINATWMGPEMKRIQGKDDILFTPIMCSYFLECGLMPCCMKNIWGCLRNSR